MQLLNKKYSVLVLVQLRVLQGFLCLYLNLQSWCETIFETIFSGLCGSLLGKIDGVVWLNLPGLIR